RAQGGLGVGLSLVKSLVELHGGTVEAKSEGLGRGCEFIVRLPSPLLGDWTESGNHTESHPGSNAAMRRILVVDDSRDAAESLAMLLRLSGHEVMIAHDGPKALEIAANTKPAVVLLD